MASVIISVWEEYIFAEQTWKSNEKKFFYPWNAHLVCRQSAYVYDESANKKIWKASLEREGQY